MPVLKHAKKKLRQDKKRTLANKKKRSQYKELIKNTKAAPTSEALSAAFKSIDKAAKANIIHENKAGRLKSALSKVAASGGAKATAPTKPTTKKSPAKKSVAKKATAKAPKKASTK